MFFQEIRIVRSAVYRMVRYSDGRKTEVFLEMNGGATS